MKILIKPILLLVIIFAFQNGFTQEVKSNLMVSPGGDTILIASIPDAEITTNVESTYTKIKAIEGNLEPSNDIAQFDSLYANAIIKLDSAKQIIFNEKQFSTLRDVDDELQQWAVNSDDLNKWRDKISERIKILQSDYFEVTVSLRIWDTTFYVSRKSGTPANALTNITDLVEALKVLQKKVKDKQNIALSKQNKIIELRKVVEDVTEFLSENRKNVQSDIFIQDMPPIWRSADSTASIKNIKTQLTKSIDKNIDNFQKFYQSEQTTLIIQLLVFLFLWFAFYYLHKKSINIEEIDEKLNLNDAREVISKHGLSALIITLFSFIWIYSTAFTTAMDINQLMYIIISLLFLPGHFDKRLRSVLFALLLLFFANQIQFLLAGKLFSMRIVMFFESFIAAWILYKIISPKFFIAKMLKKNGWSFVLKLVSILFIFVLIEIIANIFGFISLSRLLTNTTVNSLLNLNILILVVMVMKQSIAVLLRTPFAQKSYIIRSNYHLIEKRLITFIQIIGVFIWIKSVLILLGVYQEISDWFFNDLMKAEWVIGGSTIVFDKIVSFILVIIGTYLFNKAIMALFKDELYPRVKLPRGVPGAISMITGYIIFGYGLYIALGAAGIDLSNFGLVAGALGVGIGFGLQGIVANFIAGLVLAFERPIQVGDTIEVGTMMGDVTSIGVRACSIRTFDGSEVIVPNSTLITNDVTNWTLSDRRKRRDINVSVAYGTDLHEVMDLLKEVASSHPEVLKIPAPWILFDGFGDNSLDFRVRIWTTMDNGMTTKSAVAIAIYDALQEAGIQIPFPQRDLHLRSIDPSIQGLTTNKKTAKTETKIIRKKQSPKSKPERNHEPGDPDSTDDTDD